MELGMVGLGRMGGSMADRLRAAGHRVVGFDRDPDARAAAARAGLDVTASLESLTDALPRPRTVWVMVPSGAPTEGTIAALEDVLESGDLVIDGGNSNYKDSMRRGAQLQHQGIGFVDVGVSGGIWGARDGYCLMAGGDALAFQRVEPLLRALAPPPAPAGPATEGGAGNAGPALGVGYAHVGPLGAGHFTKMVHNGIEYGLMQAYAEGFELLRAKQLFRLNVAQVADLWGHGSVIRSRLLELTADALRADPDLANVEPYVEDSGEGRWTVEESVELAVPIPVISIALQARFRSRQEDPFSFRLLAALREQFGGHRVRRRP